MGAPVEEAREFGSLDDDDDDDAVLAPLPAVAGVGVADLSEKTEFEGVLAPPRALSLISV